MWARDLLKHNRKVLLGRPSSVRHKTDYNVEHTVGNTVRKVLHHIREEHNAVYANTTPKSSVTTGFSISNFVLMGQPKKYPTAQKSSPIGRTTDNLGANESVDSFAQGLRPVLLEAIQDVLDELETVYDNVSKGAKDHIHSECVWEHLISCPYTDILRRSSEIILTIGKSRTVEAYLKAAAHHRKFTVIVAESGPSCVSYC